MLFQTQMVVLVIDSPSASDPSPDSPAQVLKAAGCADPLRTNVPRSSSDAANEHWLSYCNTSAWRTAELAWSLILRWVWWALVHILSPVWPKTSFSRCNVIVLFHVLDIRVKRCCHICRLLHIVWKSFYIIGISSHSKWHWCSFHPKPWFICHLSNTFHHTPAAL